MRSEHTNSYRIILTSVLLTLTLLATGAASAAPTLSEDATAGLPLYVDWCANCHGFEGLGDGPAADYLYPRPRNFVDGMFKVRMSVSGELPLDGDIIKIIKEGMPGTSMPGWEEKFSDKEILQLTAYVKSLIDPDLIYEGEIETITVSEPPTLSEEGLSKGQELYRKLKCWECHGDKGLGDGPSASTLEDDWGNAIRAADLSKSWNFRGGGGVSDIYRTFSTGMDGTPMPSYFDTIGEEDRWRLAGHVKSLSPDQEPMIKSVLTSTMINGEIPASPDDALWEGVETYYYPLAGQIVFEPRMYSPSVDSVQIQSVYNDREVAFRMVWHDPTGGETGSSPDAVAIQFPAQLKESERPHFVLGDTSNPVNILKWTVGSGLEEANARGVGKYFPQGKDSQSLTGESVYQDGEWRVVMKRSLSTEDTGNDIQFVRGEFIPISFLAWDGDNNETGAKTAVSSWYYLTLEKSASAGIYLFTPLSVIIAIGVQFLARSQVRKRNRNKSET